MGHDELGPLGVLAADHDQEPVRDLVGPARRRTGVLAVLLDPFLHHARTVGTVPHDRAGNDVPADAPRHAGRRPPHGPPGSRRGSPRAAARRPSACRCSGHRRPRAVTSASRVTLLACRNRPTTLSSPSARRSLIRRSVGTRSPAGTGAPRGRSGRRRTRRRDDPRTRPRGLARTNPRASASVMCTSRASSASSASSTPTGKASTTTRRLSPSQASVIVPTRNSSSMGTSSGPTVLDRRRVVAGTRATRLSSRSARIETCCFSSATLVSRRPAPGLQEERAGSGLADRPGDEPVRLLVRCSTATPCRQPNDRWCRRQGPADPCAGPARSAPRPPAWVFTASDVRPLRGVADHRDRAGVHHDPLEEVEMHAQRVGEDRLDDVAVATRPPPTFAAPGPAEDAPTTARVPSAARAAISAMDSPPGNLRSAAAAPGRRATASASRGWTASCRSSRRSRPRRSDGRPAPAGLESSASHRPLAVSRHRSIGLVTTSPTGRPARRSPTSAPAPARPRRGARQASGPRARPRCSPSCGRGGPGGPAHAGDHASGHQDQREQRRARSGR